VTSDRQEFIGATGSVTEPDCVMQGKSLSGTVEAGRDPCAALSYDLELSAGQTKDILFILGNAKDEETAQGLITYGRGLDMDDLLARTSEQWQDFIAPLQVKTPDRSFDLMVNRWLPYQSMASRILARAAFYQASGAYGFRDQLQDTLSLLMLDPLLARKQLLNVAGRQFAEGDVQHWWLPVTGAGVRTLISDDVVWLSYAATLYTQVTGDLAVLDEEIAYLQGRALQEGEHDAFYQPEVSDKTDTVYEHCVKGLELAMQRTGQHGLPLILGGDWNDGMNLVGVEGKGESVWLGWFLSYTLQQFIPLSVSRGDTSRAEAMQKHLDALNKALEEHGWDGEWYRRGYFDDGAPLGSHLNDECQIDAIAQSWAVLSGVADPQRATQAMASLEKHLLDEEGGLLRLFTPPFDKTEHEPGYIKGYPRGVRENGGQYTHGATWAIMALTKLGRGDEAYKLFSLINPVHHGENPEAYRVEPYVIAADIYSVEPRRGQGGWTWYTGSAGWFYRVATEGILGLSKRGNALFLNPVLPSDWDGFELDYRHGEALYKITVRNKTGRDSLKVDGKAVKKRDAGIALTTQGQHEIVLELK
jgi:cyclic beta-1,2-glucan synthetase